MLNLIIGMVLGAGAFWAYNYFKSKSATVTIKK